MNSELIHIACNIIIQGLLYSFIVMGVHLSSRVIEFDDLTTEGSFGLGGAITALCLTSGLSGWASLPLAIAGGAIAGSITAFLHTKMKMNHLISGLVMTTALFSICLKLASSNLSIPQSLSIFSESILLSMVTLSALVGIVFLGLQRLLSSEIGLLFKSVGNSPQVVTSLGKKVDRYKIAGLALSNSLTALGGALFVQWIGFFSITGNIGTLIIGIASLILAEMINPKFSLSLIAGAILYQSIFAMTIELELNPIWNNLVKAILIIVFIQIKPRKKIILQR